MLTTMGKLLSLVIALLVISFFLPDEIRADTQNNVQNDSLLMALNEEDEDSATILVKEFEFFQPFQPPESEDMVAIKARRRQIQGMYNKEMERLEKASEKTRKNIEAHIKFLENSLEQMDKEVTAEGDTLIPARTLYELTDEFKGQELTLEEMNQIAGLVRMAYQERGYILARAYIPEQEIEDGILKIAIIEGEVGDIRVTGNKYYSERVIKRNFQQQLKHRIIREELLEKGILLTKELPGAETRIILERGEKPGTANLSLETEDRIAFELGFDANNFGSELVGKERYGTTMEITEPWWGSTLAMRWVAGNHRDASALRNFALDIPVTNIGTSISFSYIKGNYAIGQDLADLGLDGETVINGYGIRQPLMRTRNSNLTLALGYERKYSKNFIIDEVRSIDEGSVYNATLEFDSLDRFLGKNLVSFGFYRGNVKTDEVYPLSRDDVDKRFNRFNINAARIQKIYGNTNFMIRGAGQKTRETLLPMEEMAIGGYGTVRGHETSIFLGDTGYTISGELMSAPPFIAEKTFFGQRIAQMVQLAVFYDYGEVYINEPQPGDLPKERLAGFGGGVRLFYKDLVNFKFDLGFPTEEKIQDEESNYYYLMGSINFMSDELRPVWKMIGDSFSRKPQTEE